MTMLDVSARVATYTSRPKVSSRKALGLAILLEKAAPPDLTPAQRKRLAAIAKQGAKVEAVLSARDLLGSATIQPLRAEHASGWAAMEGALDAAALVPADVSDRAARAVKIQREILPAGREFTKLSALESWTYSHRVLGRIDDAGLAKEINALIGPDYLATVKLVTNNLGEALGVGDGVLSVPSTTALTDAMTRYVTTLCAYTRALSADVDEEDEASCKRFFDAVAPIDACRSAVAPGAPAPTTPPEAAPQLAQNAGPAVATTPTGG